MKKAVTYLECPVCGSIKLPCDAWYEANKNGICLGRRQWHVNKTEDINYWLNKLYDNYLNRDNEHIPTIMVSKTSPKIYAHIKDTDNYYYLGMREGDIYSVEILKELKTKF